MTSSNLAVRESHNFALYQYTPSLPPAIIAACLFTIAGFVHIYLVWKIRAKYFIPFVVGCFMEALGYAGRIWSHFAVDSLPPYIVQALLILIAPALFAASIYMMLGRLIHLTNREQYSLIPLRWLTKIFVIGDCIAFLVQAMGGGIQAGGTLNLLFTGEKIIVAGLFLQIFFFGTFLVAALTFHVRINKREVLPVNDGKGWRGVMRILYISSGIILVRSVFRVVEYLMGNDGFLLQHEYMLYLFDTVLMVVVTGLFVWWHPGKLFMRARGKVLSGGSSRTEAILLEADLRN